MTEKVQSDTTFAVPGRLYWQIGSLVALGCGVVLSFVAWNLVPANGLPVLTGLVAAVFAFLPMKRPIVRTVIGCLATYTAFTWTESFLRRPVDESASEFIAVYRAVAYSGLVLSACGSWLSAWTFERVRQARMAQRWANVMWKARADGYRLMWVRALGGRTRSSMRVLLQDVDTGREENASVWGDPIPGTYVVLTAQRRIEAVLTVDERKAFDQWTRRTS